MLVVRPSYLHFAEDHRLSAVGAADLPAGTAILLMILQLAPGHQIGAPGVATPHRDKLTRRQVLLKSTGADKK